MSTAIVIAPALAQRRKALQKANRVRTARAAVKSALGSGEMSLAEALCHPDVQRVRLAKLLRSQAGWWNCRTASHIALLRRRGVPLRGEMFIGSLTLCQRLAVVTPPDPPLDAGLTTRMRRIITAMASLGDGACVYDLAEEAGLGDGGVSGVMQGLRRRGFVSSTIIEPRPNRSVHRWSLTDKGRELAAIVGAT
jgi:hypothetical protein